MSGRLTFRYTENPDGWVTAQIAEYPEAISQGESHAEARLNALYALHDLYGPQHLLTALDIANRWQVSEAFVYRLARDGKIPVVKIGRHRRFRLDEIERWERSG